MKQKKVKIDLDKTSQISETSLTDDTLFVRRNIVFPFISSVYSYYHPSGREKNLYLHIQGAFQDVLLCADRFHGDSLFDYRSEGSNHQGISAARCGSTFSVHGPGATAHYNSGRPAFRCDDIFRANGRFE